jgi:hypothetical protein
MAMKCKLDVNDREIGPLADSAQRQQRRIDYNAVKVPRRRRFNSGTGNAMLYMFYVFRVVLGR